MRRLMTNHPFSPVPVQPRQDGWTPDRQWKFVEALARTASVTQAARAVRMSPRSAQRLRQHPLARDFRAAWDAALGQAWGQLEQVALDRAINGEKETIEREGFLAVERRRPCSDKLLIHLLNLRERALVAARAERAAEHQRAMAEARLAAIRANSGPRRSKSPLPPAPQLLGDAAAETAALHAFRAKADIFAPWPAMDDPDDQVVPDPVQAQRSWADTEIIVAPAPSLPTIGDARIRWEDFRADDSEDQKTA
jgi:hypothetical protein